MNSLSLTMNVCCLNPDKFEKNKIQTQSTQPLKAQRWLEPELLANGLPLNLRQYLWDD